MRTSFMQKPFVSGSGGVLRILAEHPVETKGRAGTRPIAQSRVVSPAVPLMDMLPRLDLPHNSNTRSNRSMGHYKVPHLTDTQERILRCIRQAIADRGEAPTV